MPAAAPAPTEEQATEALRAVMGQPPENTGEPEPIQLPVVEAAAETKPETEKAETETSSEPEPVQPEVTAQAPEDDDIASLKARLEKQKAEYDAKIEAVTTRSSQNERVLRDRFLKKAAATAEALKVLKAARSESGVPEADADRVIRELEGTMNPASPSYVEPALTAPTLDEEQALTLNNFLNEKGMTTAEADAFGNWIRSETGKAITPAELDVARHSLDGFLRIAHERYRQAQEAAPAVGKSDVIQAVKAVQRTQKAAIKASTAAPSAPKKQPSGTGPEIDYDKISKDDLSALLRASVSQYR